MPLGNTLSGTATSAPMESNMGISAVVVAPNQAEVALSEGSEGQGGRTGAGVGVQGGEAGEMVADVAMD